MTSSRLDVSMERQQPSHHPGMHRRPALQRRHRGQLDPDSHAGCSGPGPPGPHPGAHRAGSGDPRSRVGRRYDNGSELGHPTGQVSSADNGLAVAALVLASFAVLAAILAIWLGRPKLNGARSAGED